MNVPITSAFNQSTLTSRPRDKHNIKYRLENEIDIILKLSGYTNEHM